jgi:hypothetical protein
MTPTARIGHGIFREGTIMLAIFPFHVSFSDRSIPKRQHRLVFAESFAHAALLILAPAEDVSTTVHSVTSLLTFRSRTDDF